MKRQYKHYLFDLDDTLLNFKESEKLSFSQSLNSLDINNKHQVMFHYYQVENSKLWKLFEEGKTTKEHLKVERFRLLFDEFQIDLDPKIASARYLDALPETVVLMDDAIEICEWLKGHGEIGIITNGIHQVQMQRIKNSKLESLISFVSVSEICGFAKPDIRFFEQSTKNIKNFDKKEALVIGDRYDADIQGAINFGVDSCWFNHNEKDHNRVDHKYEITKLSEIRNFIL